MGARRRRDAAASGDVDGRQGEGRPQLPPGQDPRRAAEARRSPPRSSWSRRCPRILRLRPVDADAARRIYEAARRLAEGRPADDSRRVEHGEPAGEDAAAVRRCEDLPGQAGRRRAWRTELFARVIELDPETHVETAEPLGELYFKRQEWAPLVPLLEMLVRKADRKTNRELTLLYHRLAKAAGRSWATATRRSSTTKQSFDLGLDLPADADRPGGAAVQDRALGRRVPHPAPDDPGPSPRHAEGRRDRRHLLPPGAHQAGAARAHQGGEHVREERWRSSPATAPR